MAEYSVMDRINMIISDPDHATMTLAQIVTEEIREFKASEQYANMIQAEAYYRNRTDVQRKTNDVANRSNTRIEHPILKKLVDQKANYLLGKPFTVDTKNSSYGDALNDVFDQTFRRKIKSLGKGAVKSGIAWLQPYFDDGKLAFMRIPSAELVPIWRDAERTKLDAFIRFYYKKSYDLQSRAGFYNEIAKIDASAVEDAVSYPWSGAMFSDRLWQSKQALVFNTREIITQGLIQGKSVGVMASALSSRMGQSYKNAERLIRTETAHIHAEADRKAYKEAGVAEYEYMAAVNERTCDTCGGLDGRRFKVSDAEPGVNYPPIHPNCRCTTVEYDPEEALDWLNSGEPMPKRTTYQEWYSRQTAANGQGSVEVERKKAYNIKADQEQFDALLGVLPDGEVPSTLDAFQNVKYTNPEKWRQMKAKVRLYNSTASRGTLPEAASASAPQDKLQGYLLNHEHPRGKEKAHVINQVLGYNVENWETFQKKLLTEVRKSPVTKTVSTQFGERYTVPVILYGRKDRFLRLNTVWQIDTGGKDPHFITATPERKK